jgi:transaldolase
MQLFIDTANLDEIKEACDWGIISGVTTNPSLVAVAGIPFELGVKDICRCVNGPVSAEVLNLESGAMVGEARNIAQWAPNVVVKIPMTKDGIKAVKILAQENIKTNVTLVFSVPQALLAALAGATYVSPFVGRIDDAGGEGMRLVAEIAALYDRYHYSTKIIAASIRHPLHVLDAARAGAHIATVPFKVLKQLFNHPLTDIGIQRFMEDWKTVKKLLNDK